MYYDNAWHNDWQNDPTLTVTTGPLPSLSSQFTVTASGDAAEDETLESYLGVYNKTERWWAGRPVYVNTQGRLLFAELVWNIGPELGYYALHGSWSHESPAYERKWKKYGENGSKLVSVKIVSTASKFNWLLRF